MNESNLKLAEGLVDSSYIQQASQARKQREKMIQKLLAQVLFNCLREIAYKLFVSAQQRRMPKKGWDNLSIEYFMNELAIMDSNNFVGMSPSPHIFLLSILLNQKKHTHKENVGVGEREARIFSSLVAKRHYFLGHGIGRSGDIAAIQPKAAGSSLLHRLTNYMALEALKLAGLFICFLMEEMPHCTHLQVLLTQKNAW